MATPNGQQSIIDPEVLKRILAPIPATGDLQTMLTGVAPQAPMDPTGYLNAQMGSPFLTAAPGDIAAMIGAKKPSDLRGILNDQFDAYGNVVGTMGDLQDYNFNQQEQNLQFGSPQIDVDSYLARAAAAGLSASDVQAMLNPSDPDYAANVTQLFADLGLVDPMGDQTLPASPDSNFGRVWLSGFTNELGQRAGAEQAQLLSDQLATQQVTDFKKAYLDAAFEDDKRRTYAMTGGPENYIVSDIGLSSGARTPQQRATEWGNRKQLTGEELAASRAAGQAARDAEKAENEKAYGKNRQAYTNPGVDPRLAASVAPPSVASRSIIPTAGDQARTYERDIADRTNTVNAAVQVARAVMQQQSPETMFGGGILPPVTPPPPTPTPTPRRTTTTNNKNKGQDTRAGGMRRS